ncbi:MAG: biotin--[acetyl-CoA-carboxylase] ligase [Marmoricola sp.]
MTEPTSPRSPLEQERLQSAAGPDWVVQLHAEAGSTNALAAAAPARNLVVVADHQTAGRGRLERSWEVPRGAGLMFSAVFDPVVEPEWWPVIPLAAGVAVARALQPYLGVWPLLKWPNDVLIDGEKVCGILVERLDTRPAYAVIGIGINVDQSREELPVPTATSLALAGAVVDRATLFGEVLRQLRVQLVTLARSPHAVMSTYRGLSATLDRDVRVDLPGGTSITGRVVDIDAHGQLVLDTGAGERLVAAGDVVHVRPAS